AAVAILRERPHNGRDHVFGRGRSGFQGWSRARAALDQAIGGVRGDWTLHDFRRFISTAMHEHGTQPHIIEVILAHVGHRSGVAGTYNKATYLAERRRALERWAEYVAQVVTGESAKASVVRLKRSVG